MADDVLHKEKRELRKRILASRRSLSAETAERESAAIFQHIIQSKPYRQAGTVMCYAAMRDEVQTLPILAHALREGKGLSIPYIKDKMGLMEAVAVRRMSDLIRGAYDILTVKEDALEFTDPARIDLLLMPGVAYDARGHRLGMGGGFYDRFLPRAENAVVYGLAFSCQMVDAVPCLPHDLRAEYVVTERGLIHGETGKM